MKFEIKQEIFDMFPHLKVGVVVGHGLTIGQRTGALDAVIEENSRQLVERAGTRPLTEFVNIKAWRDTYKKFGVSAKKYKPTAEALLRRVVKGQPFPAINTAVDAYLAVQPLYMLPIGGYDLDSVKGDITLRRSPGNESFFPIGSTEPEYTAEGEIIYADAETVLTRKWNYRDCDHAKITETSGRILLACEASLDCIRQEDLSGTIESIVQYESTFCGGQYKTFFLDGNNPAVQLD